MREVSQAQGEGDGKGEGSEGKRDGMGGPPGAHNHSNAHEFGVTGQPLVEEVRSLLHCLHDPAKPSCAAEINATKDCLKCEEIAIEEAVAEARAERVHGEDHQHREGPPPPPAAEHGSEHACMRRPSISGRRMRGSASRAGGSDRLKAALWSCRRLDTMSA